MGVQWYGLYVRTGRWSINDGRCVHVVTSYRIVLVWCYSPILPQPLAAIQLFNVWLNCPNSLLPLYVNLLPISVYTKQAAAYYIYNEVIYMMANCTELCMVIRHVQMSNCLNVRYMGSNSNWIQLLEWLYQQVLGNHMVQCSTTLFGHKEGIKLTKV